MVSTHVKKNPYALRVDFPREYPVEYPVEEEGIALLNELGFHWHEYEHNLFYRDERCNSDIIVHSFMGYDRPFLENDILRSFDGDIVFTVCDNWNEHDENVMLNSAIELAKSFDGTVYNNRTRQYIPVKPTEEDGIRNMERRLLR